MGVLVLVLLVLVLVVTWGKQSLTSTLVELSKGWVLTKICIGIKVMAKMMAISFVFSPSIGPKRTSLGEALSIGVQSSSFFGISGERGL